MQILTYPVFWIILCMVVVFIYLATNHKNHRKHIPKKPTVFIRGTPEDIELIDYLGKLGYSADNPQWPYLYENAKRLRDISLNPIYNPNCNAIKDWARDWYRPDFDNPSKERNYL